MHHRHPDFDVADADAVVDALAGAALAVPGVDVRRSQLELERRRHTVQRSEPIGLGYGSVIVKVDEPRSHDEACRIDRVSAAYGLRRDDGDSSVEDPDIADRIELAGRIDDASAKNDTIVDRVRCGQAVTPTCALNRRQAGLGTAIRWGVGVSRPLS